MNGFARIQAQRILASRRLAQAVAEAAVLTALTLPVLPGVIGPAGAAAVVLTLVVVAASLFVVQREEVSWFGVLPVTVGAFFAVVLVSVSWTVVPAATVAGILDTAAFVALGLYLALLRDAVQVVRAIARATRIVIAASAVVEVVNGLLVPEPVPVFGNLGTLAAGGPVSGVVGSPAALAFTCLLALVAFWIEWRGHMVPRENLAAWVALAAGLLVLTRVPEAGVTVAVLVFALATTALLRRRTPTVRLALNVAIGSTLGVAAVIAAVSSVSVFTAPGSRRDRLWGIVTEVAEARPTFGWGWVGAWPNDDVVFPYALLSDLARSAGEPSAESAYLDVRLQLGFVGLVTLVIALGVALVRAWLVASARRSALHHWPMLVLALLAWWSITSSVLLTELGVLVFVAAAMSATRNRSWRKLITAPPKGRAKPS